MQGDLVLKGRCRHHPFYSIEIAVSRLFTLFHACFTADSRLFFFFNSLNLRKKTKSKQKFPKTTQNRQKTFKTTERRRKPAVIYAISRTRPGNKREAGETLSKREADARLHEQAQSSRKPAEKQRESVPQARNDHETGTKLHERT